VQLTGRTLPFDNTLRTEFRLGAVEVDLGQYWGYLPVDTPLQLESGRFTSEISLLFERPDAHRINFLVGGGGRLTDLKLRDRAEGTVLSLPNLSFELEKYSLGDNRLELRNVTLDRPLCKLVRRQDGGINWAGYFHAEPDAGNATAGPATGGAFVLDLRKIAVSGGELQWDDRAVPGGFKRAFRNLAVNAANISTRDAATCTFSASLGKEETLALRGAAMIAPAPEGNATLTGAEIDLAALNPYYAEFLPLNLERGKASFSATVGFRPDGGGTNLDVVDGSLTLTDLALAKTGAKHPSLALDELAVTGVRVDLKGRDLAVGQVRLTGPDVRVVREPSGRIDLVRLFTAKNEDKDADDKAERDPDDGGGDEPPTPAWTARIDALRIVGGEARFTDQNDDTPVRLGLRDLNLSLDGLTTREGAEMPFALDADWGGRRGSLEAKGTIGITPLRAEGALSVRDISLRPLDRLLAAHTELLFASGAASADLLFSYEAGTQDKVLVTGNGAVTDVQLKENQGDGELAGFDALRLTDLRLTGEPYRMDVAAIHLKGPRASVNIDQTGNSNVRRALRLPPPAPEPPATDEPAAAKTPAKAATPKDQADAPPAPEQEPDALEAVTIGKVSLEGGVLRFRDASVKPTYTMTMTDMGLTLTGISRAADARPKFDFTAKAGPTPLHVLGVLNPLASPPYSDLSLSVSGMELVPLTPYTLRNLGYPIEKGRLFADVKFKTENWVLTADNKFFIEQLVLGPKDKRPGAPNVPVQFGLSLLQDGNGNLTLNLPIRGRLDDPDFRVGSIVFKAIINLMFKALATPFSLIGSIFGGGSGANMDFVVFDPGRSALTDTARGKLDTVAKALAERRKLKLDVDGVIDPVADKTGLVKAIFDHKLKQQKYDDLSRRQRAKTTVEETVIEPDEYEEYLFDAYRDEDDPDDERPTSLFVVDRQPVPFMEKFLMDRITVTPEDLAALAVDRARAVKDYLLAKDPSLADRVFLLDRKKDRETRPGIPRHRADLGIK
ncbi:MAG: DUF748 domain-containing protein, partial [Pseudodesulfovibrio sp.]